MLSGGVPPVPMTVADGTMKRSGFVTFSLRVPNWFWIVLTCGVGCGCGGPTW